MLRVSIRIYRPSRAGRRKNTPNAAFCFSHEAMKLVPLFLLACLTLLVQGLVDYEQRQFDGYDCSEPEDLRAVQTGGRRNCAQPQEVANQTEVSYLLLQRAEYLRTTAYSCRVVFSRLVHYCGQSSHQTFVPHQSKLNEYEETTVFTCQEWWRKGIAVFRGREYPLTFNATNRIVYEAVGRTESTSRSVNCNGGTFQGRRQLNVWVTLDITLKEEPVLMGEVLILSNPQIVLPSGCAPSAEFCITDHATLFWTVPKGQDACKYFLNRPTKGLDVVGTAGAVTYISTDHTMIRLIKEGVRAACGDLIWSTNYPKLYLTAAHHNEFFHRKLHVAEMSLVTYVNNQDGFLHGELTGEIQREFKLILAHQCKAAQAQHSIAFARRAAEHDAAVDGETTSLGSGQFATAAGETWYKYGCRSVRVTGIEKQECFSGLPVALQPDHELRWRRRRGIPNAYVTTNGTEIGHIDFFLEPVTRRIVTEGIVVDCSREFAPLYRNSFEQWIQVMPEFMLAATPKELAAEADEELMKATMNMSRQEDIIAKLHNEGIYDADMIQRMDVFKQNPRRMMALSSVISQQNTARRGSHHIRASDLFHELPNAETYDWVTKALRFLDRWGKTAAIFLSLALLAKFLFWIGGAVIRVYTKYQSAGCGLAMASLCCPDCMHVHPGDLDPHQRRDAAQNRLFQAANRMARRHQYKAEKAKLTLKEDEETGRLQAPLPPVETPPYPPTGAHYAELNRQLNLHQSHQV